MSGTPVTSGDRLSMTLFIAAVVHVVVILGVGFTGVLPTHQVPALMEITLSRTPAERTPEDYDYLAPDDQDGGGSAEDMMRPEQTGAAIPDPRNQADLSTSRAVPDSASMQDVPLVARQLEEAPAPDRDSTEPDHTADAEAPQIDARDRVAADVSDLSQSIDWDARYPSKRRIDARTRSHAAAAYMKQWIDTVEQVGNLNFPDEILQRGLAGRLIVEVTLRPDGRVDDVRILQPSRYRLLDETALRVVEMAAPYAPIPDEVLEGNARLVITRTWEFMGDGELQAR